MSAGHVAPKSMYYAVFGALILGTILTVAAAKVDMGPLNNIVMLAIACTKATLVILFFMHVRWSSRLTWVVAMSGFFWLLILFGMGMSDYLSRGWVRDASLGFKVPRFEVRERRWARFSAFSGGRNWPNVIRHSPNGANRDAFAAVK